MNTILQLVVALISSAAVVLALPGAPDASVSLVAGIVGFLLARAIVPRRARPVAPCGEPSQEDVQLVLRVFSIDRDSDARSDEGRAVVGARA